MDYFFLLVFLAGILTFFSPCVFPVLPGFFGYMLSLGGSRRDLLTNTFLYVLGFTVTFSLFGVLLSTIFRYQAYTTQVILSQVGGFIILLFGLYTLGLLRFGFLEKTKVFDFTFENNRLTSFVFGASFAFGWSPCVGAILGSVLTLAALSPVSGFLYLLMFSVGLGVPFLLFAYFGDKFFDKFKFVKANYKYFKIIAGVLLIVMGFLMITQNLFLLSNLVSFDLIYKYL